MATYKCENCGREAEWLEGQKDLYCAMCGYGKLLPLISKQAPSSSLSSVGLSSQLFGEFKTSELDKYLYELAKEYDEVCEAYDRTVCTGPIGRDGILPANSYEMGAISRHAIRFFKELVRRAEYERGVSPELTRNALKKFRAR